MPNKNQDLGSPLLSPSLTSPMSSSQKFNSPLTKIGSGAYGTIFKATLENGNTCVVKMISKPKNTFSSPNRRIQEKFNNECSILKKLNYLIGKHTSENHFYLKMIYFPGLSLTDLCKDMYDTERTRAIATSIIEDLVLIHSNGIVHCDIKPENIVVNVDDSAKIVDFGVSILTDQPIASQTITHEYGAEGTTHYMAPEVSSLETALSGTLRKGSTAGSTAKLKAILYYFVNKIKNCQTSENNNMDFVTSVNTLGPKILNTRYVGLPEEEKKLILHVAKYAQFPDNGEDNPQPSFPALFSKASDVFSLGKTLYDLFINFDTNENSELGKILLQATSPDPASRPSLNELKAAIFQVKITPKKTNTLELPDVVPTESNEFYTPSPEEEQSGSSGSDDSVVSKSLRHIVSGDQTPRDLQELDHLELSITEEPQLKGESHSQGPSSTGSTCRDSEDGDGDGEKRKPSLKSREIPTTLLQQSVVPKESTQQLNVKKAQELLKNSIKKFQGIGDSQGNLGDDYSTAGDFQRMYLRYIKQVTPVSPQSTASKPPQISDGSSRFPQINHQRGNAEKRPTNQNPRSHDTYGGAPPQARRSTLPPDSPTSPSLPSIRPKPPSLN